MVREKSNTISLLYQTVITVSGVGLWIAAAVNLAVGYGLRQQLMVLALTPVAVLVGMFPQHFRLPLGSRFTRERLTFTLTDAIVLLVAAWYGFSAAVFVAGIEGYTGSRRTVRRWSSNVFSSGMMALTAAAAAAVLTGVLRYGFGNVGPGFELPILDIAVAVLLASTVQIHVNLLLMSTLLALRHGHSVIRHFRSFLWAAPMLLPTGTAATLMYFALQHNVLTVAVIGGPILLAIYFGQRQYRNGVEERIAVMEKAHRETIEALAVAINAKDEVTHDHVRRVEIYAAGVARLLGCSEIEIEALKAGALLHDIGKIAVPDYILNKPGKLSAAEFEKMKIHTIAGAQILGRVEFPYPIVPVVRHHHERWDGKGYPDGLASDGIPLTARILAVVDCFDAVREDRQYRKGMSREDAIGLISLGSGTQYDPRVVSTFIAHLPEFEAEIEAQRRHPAPTFGIEPSEELSEAARQVAPGAGLADDTATEQPGHTHPLDGDVRALVSLAHAAIRARSQDELVRAFTDKLNTLVPYDLCAITLVVPETGHNVVVHASGRNAELVKGRSIALGEGVTGWVIANRQPFCNTDPRLDLPPSLIEQFAIYRTLAVFPIMKARTIHGAVTLYSADLDQYTQDHQRLMSEAVALMATALSSISDSASPPDGGSQIVSITERLRMAGAVVESDLAH
ncbi:MAG TPA: HD domain-containing phosphohydrolase [Blastocatellia bacterium]|nr:HD domain-containing phosphohydrolase [Blastocatellia bacterium]